MKALVIMGVAGSGKSSLAAALADTLHWPLIEGDDYHPQANKDKMRSGLALNDADRTGWLKQLAELIAQHQAGVIVTCSALKKAYRDALRTAQPELGFVCLTISQADSLARVTARAGGHLFPPSLVASQFADFEPPDGEPRVLCLPATAAPHQLLEQSLQWLTQQESLHA